MPVIVQSRICGGATAQQKGEASELRTYVDDWNLPQADAVSLRRRLNKIVHSGDKNPYQNYLGHQEVNLFANDPDTGRQHWGAKNMFDSRAEAVIKQAETAKQNEPITQARKLANKEIITAGITAQANRVKDKARLRREQEERVAREAFEASEAGRKERQDAEDKERKEAEDKERKKEEKKKKHQEEVETRRVIREKEEAEAKQKKDEEDKKPKVKVVAPPAPVKEKEKAPAPVVVPTATVVSTEPKKEHKTKKEKAPASAKAGGDDDDSWMTEASAFNKTQAKSIAESNVHSHEAFTEEKRRALIVIDAMPMSERVKGGITCWDTDYPVKAQVFCDEYHSRQDLCTMGEKWIDLLTQSKCRSLCKLVGKLLCDMGHVKSIHERMVLFGRVFPTNLTPHSLPNWTQDDVNKIGDLDWSMIDTIVIPIVWAMEQGSSFIHGETEMYPFVEVKEEPKKKDEAKKKKK